MLTLCYLSQLRRCATNTTFITRVYNLKFYQQNAELIFTKITQHKSQILATTIKDSWLQWVRPKRERLIFFWTFFYVTTTWRLLILIRVFRALSRCTNTSLIHYTKSFHFIVINKMYIPTQKNVKCLYFECPDCHSKLIILINSF